MLFSSLLLLAGQVEARRPVLVGLKRLTPPLDFHKRQAATSVGHAALTGLMSSGYLAMDLDVGTPPQRLQITLGLDESPSDLFLTTCEGADCDLPEVRGAPIFNTSGSSTFETTHSWTNYPSGSGELSADTVTLAGITITQQPCIYEESPEALRVAIERQAAGRVSLGMYGDKNSIGGEPFYRAIGKYWPDQEFGLFVGPMDLSRPPTSSGPPSESQNAGELALGGLNRDLYSGQVTYHTCTGDHWALPLTGVKVGDTSLLPSSSGAARRAEANQVAFTLTGGSLVSPSFADRLAAAVPGWTALTEANSTIYYLPCDTHASLTVTADGQDLTLPPSAWIYTAPDGRCAALITPVTDSHRLTYGYDDSVDLVLGLHALQIVYTAFKLGDSQNEPQIGFAELSDAAKAVTPNSSAAIPGAAASNPTLTASGIGLESSPTTAAATSGAWSVSGPLSSAARCIEAVLAAFTLAVTITRVLL